MSFDWNEYFLLARELSGDNNLSSSEEAKKRSAISRAYYSVIIQARTKICSLTNRRHPNRNTHAWTINEYLHHSDPLARSIGSRLKRLKKRRERADYDNHIRNLDSELISSLSEAEKLIEDVDKLR